MRINQVAKINHNTPQNDDPLIVTLPTAIRASSTTIGLEAILLALLVIIVVFLCCCCVRQQTDSNSSETGWWEPIMLSLQQL